MPFVKLDCGMLNSSIWLDRPARELFITALLMAEPYYTEVPLTGLQPDSLDPIGYEVPPGWYGFVHASPLGVIRAAGMDIVEGRDALRRLFEPDGDSRSQAFQGRRLARVNGGLIVLNYDKYRQRDYTATERSRRYREKLRDSNVTALRNDATPLQPVTQRHATQAEAEAEAEKIKNTSAAPRPRVVNVKPPKPPEPLELTEVRTIYPKRSGSQPWDRAAKACRARLTDGHTWEQMIAGARRYAEYCRATHKLGTEYVMQAATFYGPECHFLSPWDAPAGPTAVGKPQPTPEEVQQAREDYERRKAASVAAVGIVAANAAPAAQRGALPLPDLRINRN